MTPHLAIAVGEIFAIAGMIVFFLCCFPKWAFAAGSGIRMASHPAAGYHLLMPAESKAMIQDRRNSHNPLYRVIDFLVRATGKRRYSYPLALVTLSLITRLALLPLSIRQYRDSLKLKQLQLEMQTLRERYAKNPSQLHAQVSALQRQHGINPLAGILFALVQGVVFLCLYYMVALYQYQFSHGAFLWIGSALAHSYPKWAASSLANPDLPLLLFYGLSMCFTPLVALSADQKNNCLLKANAIFSAIFLSGMIWLRHTPSAFVLYWLISNILSLLTTALMAHWVKPIQNQGQV